MTAPVSQQIIAVKEQRFVLPGRHSWKQFKEIQAVIGNVPGVRISYLDGRVELMTIGEPHENLKKNIAILLELYFFEREIEFIPVGSATREDESREVSFEPDESYYIGDKKDRPDLAVEVVITSGGINKLEKYKRLKIAEVWFWEDNRLSLYRLRGEEYEQLSRSEFLPELDLDLLARCVIMPSRLESRREFLNGMHRQV
ncbi:Uma2 family endonuclease [Kamptonema formosum]|uniref:Uma2 family endonuclease n=1 Tax=Kamptonema formosum TaxID=331992 RepID=UPI00037C9113|nr:Uma2 family endonuclease [Oscillatoria sp. PCC 10802]